VPYNVALLCRRLYGRYLAPVSKHLDQRIDEIEAGRFDTELEDLKKMEDKKLHRRYAERDIEAAYE
jgi:hypothetical protein